MKMIIEINPLSLAKNSNWLPRMRKVELFKLQLSQQRCMRGKFLGLFPPKQVPIICVVTILFRMVNGTAKTKTKKTCYEIIILTFKYLFITCCCHEYW